MSDMTLSQAAAECHKFAQTVKAFQRLGDVAQTLLGLEQNITEREALRAALSAQIDEARGTLGLELEAVERARVESRSLVETASAEALEIRRKAKREADDEVRRAASAVEAAGVECANALASASAARADLDGLSAQLAEAREIIARAEAAKAALSAAGV